jgi:hypothetical protein
VRDVIHNFFFQGYRIETVESWASLTPIYTGVLDKILSPLSFYPEVFAETSCIKISYHEIVNWVILAKMMLYQHGSNSSQLRSYCCKNEEAIALWFSKDILFSFLICCTTILFYYLPNIAAVRNDFLHSIYTL